MGLINTILDPNNITSGRAVTEYQLKWVLDTAGATNNIANSGFTFADGAQITVSDDKIKPDEMLNIVDCRYRGEC